MVPVHYVHIQKDKRKGFRPCMEKGIFMESWWLHKGGSSYTYSWRVQNEEDIDIPDIPDPNSWSVVVAFPVPDQKVLISQDVVISPRNPQEMVEDRHPPPQIDDSDDDLGFTVIDCRSGLESEEFAG